MAHPASSSVAENLCRRFGCGKEDAIIALKLARGAIFLQLPLVSLGPVIAVSSAQAMEDGQLRYCKSTGTCSCTDSESTSS